MLGGVKNVREVIFRASQILAGPWVYKCRVSKNNVEVIFNSIESVLHFNLPCCRYYFFMFKNYSMLYALCEKDCSCLTFSAGMGHSVTTKLNEKDTWLLLLDSVPAAAGHDMGQSANESCFIHE